MTLPRLATLALSSVLAACSGSDPADPPFNIGGTSSGGTGGTGGSNTSGSATGGSAAAGSANGGSGAGGSFAQGGSGGGTGGTFGASGAGAGGGGAGGAGGTGGAAGGTGGTAAGGGGAGGMGGTGGAPTGDKCDGFGWVATAVVVNDGDPVANAIDRDADRNQSRYSTGRPMAVGDWLQVDLGESMYLDDVSIRWGANDYSRGFDIRLTDTPLAHTSSATVADYVGTAGTQKVVLPVNSKGRYLLITNKNNGGSTNWWSIQDVFVTCGELDPGGGGGSGGGGAGGAGGGGAGGNGGTAAGGTDAGGTNAGGTNAGGTNAGGTDAGGTNAGGTDAGGTNAGGTDTGGTAGAGGTDVGGTTATGGTEAGGTAGTGGTAPVECAVKADCVNDNACLDVDCVGGQCVKTPNSAACAGDNDPCTDDVCSQGSCGQDTGVCSGSELVMIRVHRPQEKQHVYVNPADGILISTGTADSATVFEEVFLSGTKLQFKLKEAETGMFVGIGANERMFANTDEAGAMVFGAPDCTAPYVGLYAYGDDDNARAVTAEANSFLEATRGQCDPTNTGSWEKFELLPVTGACASDIDCDDGNPCTAETCNAGKCAFLDQPSSVTCADDGNACTADVCMGGLCTHETTMLGGTCNASVVTIRANRNGNYIVLNDTGSYLDWSAPTIDTAGTFELVDQVGTSFKLRAENGMFVRISGPGANPDELIADASYLDAAIFDNAACGTKQSFRAVSDVDDADRFVKTDTAHLRAINNGCGTTNTSWEQFEFTPVP